MKKIFGKFFGPSKDALKIDGSSSGDVFAPKSRNTSQLGSTDQPNTQTLQVWIEDLEREDRLCLMTRVALRQLPFLAILHEYNPYYRDNPAFLHCLALSVEIAIKAVSECTEYPSKIRGVLAAEFFHAYYENFGVKADQIFHLFESIADITRGADHPRYLNRCIRSTWEIERYDYQESFEVPQRMEPTDTKSYKALHMDAEWLNNAVVDTPVKRLERVKHQRDLRIHIFQSPIWNGIEQPTFVENGTNLLHEKLAQSNMSDDMLIQLAAYGSPK